VTEVRRPPWSEVKQALERAGFRPSKRLGQNFLLDANMARAIARDAQLQRGAFVVEVGPGCGALTFELLALSARVLAVEIDGRLLDVLRELLGPREGLELLHSDALDGKHQLAPALVERCPSNSEWDLVSNLPYSAGTPILVGCARLAHPPRAMTALLQRELVERIAATPGSRERSGVSVKLQASYEVELVRRVPPALFWPVPQVDSAVLRMKLRTPVPAAGELERLDQLVDTLFQARRKTVLRTLADRLGSRELATRMCDESGVDGGLRPEMLPLERWLALAAHPGWRLREG
jgi:16S rRNA (adenine1518-N6/adenine1519-N6)-dimethyltransferase